VKAGDIVKFIDRYNHAHNYLPLAGQTGIIIDILRSEMNDDGAVESIVTVMIGNKVEEILQRYIEVVK